MLVGLVCVVLEGKLLLTLRLSHRVNLRLIVVKYVDCGIRHNLAGLACCRPEHHRSGCRLSRLEKCPTMHLYMYFVGSGGDGGGGSDSDDAVGSCGAKRGRYGGRQ